MTRKIATIAALLLAAGWVVYISQGLFDSPALQRDLGTYQQSAKLFHDGGDPYDLSSLIRYSNDSSMLKYVYPPQTLIVFQPLCIIPTQLLRYAYFFIQVAAVCFLVWIWRKHFIPHPYALPMLIVFVLFAFRGGLSVDITSANITLFDNCVLWCGFVAYLNRRYAVFAVLILFASLFKNVEILFLGLLLLERGRQASKWFAVAFTCFLVYHISGYLVYPEFYREWIHNVSTNPEWGAYNPAALPAIEGVVFGVLRLLGVKHVWGYSGYATYLVYALALPVLSWLALRRTDLLRDRMSLLMLTIFGYAILLPRFKDYSYILLIAPAALVILTRMGSRYYQAVAILLIIVPLFVYQPFAVAIMLYVFMIVSIRRDKDVRSPEAA